MATTTAPLLLPATTTAETAAHPVTGRAPFPVVALPIERVRRRATPEETAAFQAIAPARRLQAVASGAVPAAADSVLMAAVVADPGLLVAAVVAVVSARVEVGAMAVVAVPMGAVALMGEAAVERGLLARPAIAEPRALPTEIYFRSKLTSI